MKYPRRTVMRLVWLLACVVGLLAVGIWAIREPTYRGRGMQEWLNGFDSGVTATNGELRAALRQMGDRAAVCLVPMLTARESPMTLRIIRFAKKQSIIPIPFVPASVKHRRAVKAFQMMREEAIAAAPALVSIMLKRDVRRLESHSPADRAEFALLCLGPGVVPHLRGAFLSKDERVRIGAIVILRHQLSTREPGVTAEVDKAMSDSEPILRAAMAAALGGRDVRRDVAVPRLTQLRADPSPEVRGTAAASMIALGPGAEVAIRCDPSATQ